MSYSLLDAINYPKDLKKLKPYQLQELAIEMREFILNVVALKEGHLGASLGVVELSIALHYFYNTPIDQIIWDVGHQAYGHKILTGRKSKFNELRRLNGMSGFPVREESEYDVFGTGHSSTSISAMLGIAIADDLQDITREHICVIGDASIVSGMALEALNHLVDTKANVTVILNDNNIGIDRSVGGLNKTFQQENTTLSQSFFNAFGLNYIGIVDGHNFPELFDAFSKAKQLKGPKVIHIKTIKGKGYAAAEKDQIGWHAPGKFDKITSKRNVSTEVTFPKVVGLCLKDIFRKNTNTIAITPAMLTGSALIGLKKEFPNRVFDVGIAEQHAVTLAAGLATQGYHVFCVIYSTFLQRAWDQVIHDVVLQNLPVTFCVDRAGMVGSDGATHHGLFDASFARSLPNVGIACPKDKQEIALMLESSLTYDKPLFIRYPKSKVDEQEEVYIKEEVWQPKIYFQGHKNVILSTGELSHRLLRLIVRENLKVCLVHLPMVKPFPAEKLSNVFENAEHIIHIEEALNGNSLKQIILEFMYDWKLTTSFDSLTFKDEFITHGQMSELREKLGFSDEQLVQYIKTKLALSS